MSTKLYNGLKLKDPSWDLFELVPMISSAIRPAFEEASRQLVAEELVAWIDDPNGWPEASKRSYPIFDVERAWSKRQTDLGAHHVLNDPLRFSIVFGRSSAGNMLAYPYYNEDRYRKALKRLRIFDDYHYQNSSDRPKSISQKAWTRRYEEWESLMAKDGSFGELPTWELGRSMAPFSEVLMGRERKFNPNRYVSLDGRLRSILVRLLVPRALVVLQIPRDAIFSAVFDAQRSVNRYLETPEGIAVPRPHLLPRGTYYEYDALPTFEIEDSIIDALLEFHIERLGSR